MDSVRKDIQTQMPKSNISKMKIRSDQNIGKVKITRKRHVLVKFGLLLTVLLDTGNLQNRVRMLILIK